MGNMNHQVKKAIHLWEQSHQQEGKRPNWMLFLGLVVLELNAKEQKGKYGVSLFETVYGFKHQDHNEIEVFEKMCKCRTVAEQLALSSKHTKG